MKKIVIFLVFLLITHGSLSSLTSPRTIVPIAEEQDLPTVPNNNPFGLRKTAIQWRGEVSSSNGFEAFSSLYYGTRAGLINLRHYKGLTLREAVLKYAPPSDGNHVEKYLSFFKERNFLDDSVLISDDNFYEVAHTIFFVESGKEVPINFLKEIK